MEKQNSFHGKYIVRTNITEKDEETIWNYYNVIRTVETVFRVLKNDLDIRPVYHKSDEGIKAHLHLAILAYCVVSMQDTCCAREASSRNGGRCDLS